MTPALAASRLKRFRHRASLPHLRACDAGQGWHPIAWPVCARLLEDGRLLLTTSIGLPQKAFNIRRDPRVSMFFSLSPKPAASRRLAQCSFKAKATAEDRIVTDMASLPELRAYFIENIFASPAARAADELVARTLADGLVLYAPIYVTPTRIRHWPTCDFSAAPREIEVPSCGLRRSGRWPATPRPCSTPSMKGVSAQRPPDLAALRRHDRAAARGDPRFPGAVEGPASLLAHHHDDKLWNLHAVLIKGRPQRRDGGWVFERLVHSALDLGDAARRTERSL